MTFFIKSIWIYDNSKQLVLTIPDKRHLITKPGIQYFKYNFNYYFINSFIQIMDNTDSNYYEYEIYKKDTIHNSQSVGKEVKENQKGVQKSGQVIENTREYKEYFMDVQIEVNEKIAQCNNSADNKLQHKIINLNNQDNFNMLIDFNRAKIFVVGSQCNGIIIKYQVWLGNFKIQIDMVNRSTYAPIGLQFIGLGSYGQIFIIPISKDKNIACKRIRFTKKTIIWSENEQGEQLRQEWKIRANINQIHETILQYSIYRICSFYKIGPSTVDCLGFDLVCFNDAIQFYMQHCSRQFTSQNYEQQLKICTRILHKMKIIHKDIKPQNILYSQSNQSYVITDFGISHSVQQQPGQLTQTYQQGTLGYMSPEMAEIKKDKSGFIDLYYNDLYALKTSLAEIKLQRNKIMESQQQIQQSMIRKKKIHIQYMMIKVIFMIVNCEIQETIQLIKEYNLYSMFFEQLDYLQMHFVKYSKIREKLIDQNQNFSKYKIQVKQVIFFSKKKLSKQQIQFMVRAYGMTRQLNYELSRFVQNWRIRNIVDYLNSISMMITATNQQKIFTYQTSWQIKYQEKYLENMRRNNFHKMNDDITEIINISFNVFFYYIQSSIYYERAKNMYQQISQYQNSSSTTEHIAQYKLIVIILELIKSKNNKNCHKKLLELVKIYPKEILIRYEIYLRKVINVVQFRSVMKQYQQIIQHYNRISLTEIQIKVLIQIKFMMLKFELEKTVANKKLLSKIKQLQNTLKQYNLQSYYYYLLNLVKGKFLQRNNQPKQAIQIFQQLRRFSKQTKGQNSYRLFICKHNLASCYIEINELQQSEKLLLEIIQNISQIHGEKNRNYFQCMMQLIQVYIKKNQFNNVSMYYKRWFQLTIQFQFGQEYQTLETNRYVLKYYLRNGLMFEIQKFLSRIQQKFGNKSQIKQYYLLIITSDYYRYKCDFIKVREIQKQLSILIKSLSKSKDFLMMNLLYANLCMVLGYQYYDEACQHYQFIILNTENTNSLHLQSLSFLGRISLEISDYKQAYNHFNSLLEIFIQQQLESISHQLQIRFNIIKCLFAMKQYDIVIINILKVVKRLQEKKILQQNYFQDLKQTIIHSYIHSKKVNKQKKMLMQSLKKLNLFHRGISYYGILILYLADNYYNMKAYMHTIYYIEYLMSIDSSFIVKQSQKQQSVYTQFYYKYKMKKQRALKYELLQIERSQNNLCYKHCRLIRFYSQCRAKTIIVILLTFLLEKVCKCGRALEFQSFYKLFQKGFKYRVCNEIVKTGKLKILKKKEKTSVKLKKITLFKKIQFLNRKLRLNHNLEPLKTIDY